MEKHCPMPTARPRRLWKRLLCAALAAALLSALAACGEEKMPKPEFPLTAETVNAALEQTGLPGVLSGEETESYTEGQIAYVLRSPTESYLPGGAKLLLSSISSAVTKDQRYLTTLHLKPAVAERPVFAWEDWKQYFVFSALLFGGFSDEEELYRAFSKLTEEDSEPLQQELDPNYTTEWFSWSAQLPAGYCTVRYSLSPSKIDSSSYDYKIQAYTARMTITLYETKGLYDAMMREAAESREAAERERAEAVANSPAARALERDLTNLELQTDSGTLTALSFEDAVRLKEKFPNGSFAEEKLQDIENEILEATGNPAAYYQFTGEFTCPEVEELKGRLITLVVVAEGETPYFYYIEKPMTEAPIDLDYMAWVARTSASGIGPDQTSARVAASGYLAVYGTGLLSGSNLSNTLYPTYTFSIEDLQTP